MSPEPSKAFLAAPLSLRRCWRLHLRRFSGQLRACSPQALARLSASDPAVQFLVALAPSALDMAAIVASTAPQIASDSDREACS